MKIYSKRNHKIIKGDILEVLQSDTIKNGSVDLIFVDPPYNIGKEFNSSRDKWSTDDEYLEWCYKWLGLAIEKLKPNGSLYVMMGTQYMAYFDIYLRKKMAILSRIIWHYDSSGVQAQSHFGSLYEPIIFCVKNKIKYTFNSESIKIKAKTGAERNLMNYRSIPPKKYNSTKIPGNVWQMSRVRFKMPEYETHPTQKPEHLLERIIKASSNEGDTVLDLFSGTFTTSAVASKLKRKSIGVEQDGKYVKIGLQRLKFTNGNIGRGTPVVR
jgi:site-specific DNA-methyltransferase (adenine-specific)